MNPKIFIEQLYYLILICSILMLTNQAYATNSDLSNGTWFVCEFAHSQIPPEDNCIMLDDDGFQIINGIVYRVKIKNSIETTCRHNRVGNCFFRHQAGLFAERSELGPIKLSDNKIHLTLLGCTQEYSIIKHSNYSEIIPDSEICWWASRKHYFISQYIGKIQIL